jgi:hypothetical protein
MALDLGIVGPRAGRGAVLVRVRRGLGDHRTLMMQLVEHHADFTRPKANGEHPRCTSTDDLHRHWDSSGRWV